MGERKKHGWPLWFAAGVILLPVLYVASIGPASRLSQEGMISEAVLEVYSVPIAAVLGIAPDWASIAVLRYMEFCGVEFDL